MNSTRLFNVPLHTEHTTPLKLFTRHQQRHYPTYEIYCFTNTQTFLYTDCPIRTMGL